MCLHFSEEDNLGVHVHAVGSEDMPVHAFLCMTENKTEWRKDQKQEMVNMLHQSLIIKL